MRMSPEARTLLLAAVGLAFLSSLSAFDRIRIGPSPYLLWLPLAFDASIAAISGATLFLGSRWFDSGEGDLEPTTRSPDLEELDVIRAENQSLRAELAAFESRPLESLPAPQPESELASSEDAETGEDGERFPLPAIPMAPPALTSKIGTSGPPVRPLASLYVPEAPTDEEVEGMMRLGGLLGVTPTPREERDKFARRFLRAISEETPESSDSSPLHSALEALMDEIENLREDEATREKKREG